MDGFGRYRGQAADEIKLYALGAERICPQLMEVIGAVNKRRGATTLVTEGPDAYLNGSDHFTFYLAGIPAVMFTDLGSGVYHTPEDDAEPIEYAKLASATRLIFEVARELGNPG